MRNRPVLDPTAAAIAGFGISDIVVRSKGDHAGNAERQNDSALTGAIAVTL